MKGLKLFIISMLTTSLFLALTNPGISQPPEGKGPNKKEVTHEKSLELYPPGEEPIPPEEGMPGAGITYGHATDKKQVYEILSKELNVDKETIRKLEEKTYKDDHSFRNVPKILVLSRLRTNMLIESGKYTKDQDKQAIQESIDYFFTSIHKAGLGRERGGWGELAKEVGMSGHDLFHVAKAVLKGYWVDDAIMKDIQSRGLSYDDALKIYILARNRTDEIKETGVAPKGQEYDIIKSSANHFLDKKNKGSTWEELAKEGRTNVRDLNMIAHFIEVTGTKTYAE